ncbi:MAG TPA: NAD(P)H-quinone oxidoreductase [Polyangiaceae bacterium]|jgi:putative PIG3 family NAD(P)H quinone oxidoreductase
MKAVVVARPGGPEELRIADVPAPSPGPGELAIDVVATALNRADLLQRRGLYPPPAGASEILGLECAGVVSELGADVAGRALGERVMALLPGGGYAERVVVPEAMAMVIPSELDFSQAAAIPEAFLTAREALVSAGKLRAQESVLVHAAAGGVGLAAVQLARALGARVFATAGSTEKCARVRELGADVVVNYKLEDFADVALRETSGRGLDLILDFVGATHMPQHARCLAEQGRHVLIGLLGGARAELDLGRLLMKRQTLTGLVMRTRSVAEKIALTRAFARDTLPLFSDGRLQPVIDSVYPLAEIARAHERMEANLNLGKIVVTLRST